MMFLSLRQRVLTTAALSLILVAGSGAAFAQGRGHGGDKGNHGGGNGRGNGQGQEKKQDRGQRGEQRFERPQMQPQGRQQVFMGPPIREPQFPGRGRDRKNERAEQGRREVPIQQQYQVMRQRDDSDRRNWQRQRELSYDRTPRDSGKRDRYQREQVFQQRFPTGGFYGYKNYGQYRSQQVHGRNAERKAWKNEEGNSRRNRISTNSYNGQPYYGDSRSHRWQEYALRNIIANVRQYRGDNGRSYAPQYGQVYYAPQPTYYPYQSYAAAPVNYQTYDDSYYPQYGPYASVYSDASNGVRGNPYLRDSCGRLVAVGYEQGYADGLAAARTRQGNANYYDPYVYNEKTYDPYSSSLGVDRRYLSDGYGLGYQDALDGDYGDDLNNGQVDLVSVLIGTALQMIS